MLGLVNWISTASVRVSTWSNSPNLEILTIWMADYFDDLCLSPAANLTVQAISQIQTTSYKLPTPAFVTNAVSPEILVVKRREWRSSVANEAVGCMSIHAEQERNE